MTSSIPDNIIQKARKIKLLITDCDGVLTDTGVYYSEQGELLKKFSIRDGMGVERLRKHANIDTGIMSGELSPSLKRRAEKLKITECHLGIKDKGTCLHAVAERLQLSFEQIAFIGDDVNDLDAFALVGLTACPADAMREVKDKADIILTLKGGEGAFREYAELILSANLNS